ncbi:hypothetical protein [Limnobacter sp.]|uniref:hypothetical protein n=1 Tax=Limnobacter sp. TaxID=2003368 RepID=UPI0035152F8A
MNEWPENFTGMDVDGSAINTLSLAVKTALFAVLLTSSIGLAQAAGLDHMASAQWLALSDAWAGWFADGAVSGFDAAGAMAAAW